MEGHAQLPALTLVQRTEAPWTPAAKARPPTKNPGNWLLAIGLAGAREHGVWVYG